MADIAKINIEVETSSVKKAVGDLESLNVAAASTTSSVQKLGTATHKNANDTAKETVELNKNTVAQKKNNTAIQQGTSLRGKNRRLERAITGIDPLTGKMARDLGVNRFNTANIAAQFQDIGVTAAMGMNPMTIALQQGTQLSAILNNMGNPLKGLAQAFSQLINPIALVSIAVTGLIAVLVQMVDWGKVWESTTKIIGDALDWLADHFYILAAALGTFLAIEVVTHLGTIWTAVSSLIPLIGKLAVNLYKLGAAWLVGMGPIGWAVIAITGLVVALNVFRDELENLLGFDIVDLLKTGINALITMFANGLNVLFNTLKLFWKSTKRIVADFVDMLVDVLKMAESFGGGWIDTLLGGDQMAKDYAALEKLKRDIRKDLGADKPINSVSEILLEGVEDWTQPKDYLGNAYDAITNMLHEAADKIRNAGKDVEDASKEAWDKIVKGVEGQKIEMAQEADLLGRIGEDYYITKEKYDLLNKAREAGITLTAEQTKYIEEQSVALGQQADALDKLNQRFEFAKSTTTSFFTDMNHALREGQTLWEAFGNAVTNVLNKILDKMTEIGVDYLFAGFKGSGLFGSTKGVQVYSSPEAVGPYLPNALGSAWLNGVQKFATGGIVASPTLFGTRNGAGLMGEAGPEAIMPLTRGANGELGVKAEGVGGSSVVVNVINNSNSKATVNQRQTEQGTEIDVVIDQLVADKLGTVGSASNTAMNTWNNRQLIAR